MAKSSNSHVPKFGYWDNDNVPYTAFFENARKEKAGVRMNPNDPEENPEAFMWGTVGLETEGDSYNYKSNSAKKHHIEEHYMGHNPGRSRKSSTSEFSSDKSNSDHALAQLAGPRRLKSDRKKGSNSFSPSVPAGHSESLVSDIVEFQLINGWQHHRAASVPKFGAWDETDPTSGEGFTVIFNKVKQEKQIASTQFPVVPEQTHNYSDGQRSNENSLFSSKICCCVFSRGRD